MRCRYDDGIRFIAGRIFANARRALSHWIAIRIGRDIGCPRTGNSACQRRGQVVLSLWNAVVWKPRIDAAVDVLRSKLAAGVLAQRVDQVQGVGRLLSTRHRTISLAGRGRVVVPDGFREFLGVDPGGDLLVVGAAVCVELWNPNSWSDFITNEMPDFRRQIDELTV